jgi:hypothetical protein
MNPFTYFYFETEQSKILTPPGIFIRRDQILAIVPGDETCCVIALPAPFQDHTVLHESAQDVLHRLAHTFIARVIPCQQCKDPTQFADVLNPICRQCKEKNALTEKQKSDQEENARILDKILPPLPQHDPQPNTCPTCGHEPI